MRNSSSGPNSHTIIIRETTQRNGCNKGRGDSVITLPRALTESSRRLTGRPV